MNNTNIAVKRTALITGATSGIGRATAQRLAKEGWRLILTGRRKERLDELCSELLQNFDTETLSLHFDVRVKTACAEHLLNLPTAWQNIDLLVNNAGLASGLEPIQEGDTDDWEQMIDTNIKGLLYVTRIISPLMIQQKSGHIINIGSIAGKEVYPNGTVYCATKHAVDAISKGMRLDLVQYGIKVSQVCPGAVDTEFSEVRFHGDKDRAKSVYKGFKPLSGDDVADVITYIVNLPEHICINDLIVMPKNQASAYITHRQ